MLKTRTCFFLVFFVCVWREVCAREGPVVKHLPAPTACSPISQPNEEICSYFSFLPVQGRPAPHVRLNLQGKAELSV